MLFNVINYVTPGLTRDPHIVMLHRMDVPSEIKFGLVSKVK